MEGQTPEQRRKIRFEYRTLIDETEKNRQDLIIPEDEGLSIALDKADELFEHVKGTREAVLDSHFLVLASKLGAQKAQQLQTDFRSFEPHVFVEKMITLMCGRRIVGEGDGSDEDEDEGERENRIQRLEWGKLGQDVTSCFRRTPTAEFMFGVLEMEIPKAKPKAQRAPPTKEVKKVNPRDLNRVETRQEATTKEVERIHNILLELTSSSDDDNAELTPISLYEFAVNPNSFSQTVENFFHISFLTQKGTADIHLDEDGLPVIVPCNPYKGSERGVVVTKKQNVISLSMSEWKEIIEIFQIKHPLIPSRPNTEIVANGAGTSSDEVDMDDDDDEGQR